MLIILIVIVAWVLACAFGIGMFAWGGAIGYRKGQAEYEAYLRAFAPTVFPELDWDATQRHAEFFGANKLELS